jgi:hypothetical protein
MCILDRKVKLLWNCTVELEKVQWNCYSPEDATWEHEYAMQAEYSHFLKNFESFDCTWVCNASRIVHK